MQFLEELIKLINVSNIGQGFIDGVLFQLPTIEIIYLSHNKP